MLRGRVPVLSGATQLNGGPPGNDYNTFAAFLLGLPNNALVLAEVEFETADGYERFEKPDFAVEDVTTDVFFTGVSCRGAGIDPSARAPERLFRETHGIRDGSQFR